MSKRRVRKCCCRDEVCLYLEGYYRHTSHHLYCGDLIQVGGNEDYQKQLRQNFPLLPKFPRLGRHHWSEEVIKRVNEGKKVSIVDRHPPSKAWLLKLEAESRGLGAVCRSVCRSSGNDIVFVKKSSALVAVEIRC